MEICLIFIFYLMEFAKRITYIYNKYTKKNESIYKQNTSIMIRSTQTITIPNSHKLPPTFPQTNHSYISQKI
jgi:hypothetical protein